MPPALSRGRKELRHEMKEHEMESSIIFGLVWVYLEEAERRKLFSRWIVKFGRYRAAGLAALGASHVAECNLSRTEWEPRVRMAIGEVLAHWNWYASLHGREGIIRMKGARWQSTLPREEFRECWPFNKPRRVAPGKTRRRKSRRH